jgi:hypothetical protein
MILFAGNDAPHFRFAPNGRHATFGLTKNAIFTARLMGKFPRGFVLVTGSTAILAWGDAAHAEYCLGFCARSDPETGTIFGYTYEAIRTVALALSGPAAVITLIATWRNVNA